MDGTFAQRTIDADGDGLIDQLAIAPRANVLEAGSYDVQVRLRASNGKFLQRSRRVVLPAAAAAPEVLFGAEEITNDLAVNGPYEVEMARYDCVLAADVVPADIRYSLGQTAAYALAAFERPALRIAGGSAAGADTNGNGLYDRLDIHLRVAADFAGFYTWSATLTDRNGAELGFHNGSRFLNSGEATIVFSFDGNTIGKNGVDGPYTLGSLLLFGASQSLVAPVAFVTGPLRASEFEGCERLLVERVRDQIATTVNDSNTPSPNRDRLE